MLKLDNLLMCQYCFIIMLICFFNTNSFCQTPGGINYQGYARNQYLVGLKNVDIGLRFTIKEKNINGPVVYAETRTTRTDSFGVFSVVIGAPGAVSQSGDIRKVPWSDTTKKFLQVELNTNDPSVMST